MINLDKSYIAIDLGAGSGRVILGSFGDKRLDLHIVHRFPNEIQEIDGHLRWNTKRLFEDIKVGLRKIASMNLNVVSLGVDTWGVDYGLFDAEGNLLEEPVCYRDRRTTGAMKEVFKAISKEDIFRKTGSQFLPINTLYQIFAQRKRGEWPKKAARLLMMPDIFHFYLTGSRVGEFTMATTTQLLNTTKKIWDADLFHKLDIPLDVMPKLLQPGQQIGILLPKLQKELNMPAIKIVAPATHDTASAVVGTPLRPGWGYISSGTWSLVGIETRSPIMNNNAFRYNFTNEGGAFGSNRFLKNVMGLWILERCREQWRARNELLEYDLLIEKMKESPSLQTFINPDDVRFLNPADMIGEIRTYLHDTGQQATDDQIGLSKIILESLAMRYAAIFAEIQEQTGEKLQGIHIIGGGSQNDFLNQATANATGLQVIAGPVEATAIGNLMVQAIANGRFPDMQKARDYIASMIPLKKYVPEVTRVWREAFKRYRNRLGV
ncbi:MAG: rhamnulokinase family protein [bacterium]